MIEHEIKFLADLDEKIRQFKEDAEAKYKSMVTFFVTVFVAILGASLVIGSGHFSKDGETRSQVATNTEILKRIGSDYVPTWYIAGLTEMYNLNTEKIVATLAGDNEKVKQINVEFLKVVNIMQTNFIQMRGGVTNLNRNAKNETVKGGCK